MKLFFYIFLYLYPASSLLGQQASSLYQLSFPGLDSTIVQMLDYQGKKVVVAACDASNPDRELLRSLDSLYKNNKNRLMVIAVPVNDFGTAVSQQEVKKSWLDTLQLSYVVTAASLAQKGKGSSQHPLLQWVTYKNQNRHFDHDVNSAAMLFVISETGRLFAVLRTATTVTGPVMGNILAMEVPDH